MNLEGKDYIVSTQNSFKHIGSIFDYSGENGQSLTQLGFGKITSTV